jgi:hypothetical protein
MPFEASRPAERGQADTYSEAIPDDLFRRASLILVR